MRLLIESDLQPVGGIVGAGFDEFRWPLPVHPGDELYIKGEVLEARPSKSRPTQGNHRGQSRRAAAAGVIGPSNVLRRRDQPAAPRRLLRAALRPRRSWCGSRRPRARSGPPPMLAMAARGVAAG